MDLQHYKAASERTDADERALIPAIRRKPNKAQHSPLPWEIGDSVENPRGMAPFTAINDGRYGTAYAFGEERSQRLANAKLIVASVNHADKLAEALREIFKQCAMVHKYWGDGCNSSEADAAVTQATEALAAYEAAQ